MRLFGSTTETKPTLEIASPKSIGDLRFVSTSVLERDLDGSEERFLAYFFALYHCSPDDPGGINERREQLKLAYPNNVVPAGKRFVLTGEAAFQALAAYYQALVICETLPSDFRAYAGERLDAIANSHSDSQSLPIPIDLTEGQLSQDRRLEFLTCIAISTGQVVLPLSG